MEIKSTSRNISDFTQFFDGDFFKITFLRYKLTSAFLIDSYSILDGTTVFIWKFAILAAVGIITSVIGTYIFKKKDLPL